MTAVTIRPATRADAMDLVVFVDMAGEGFASYFWSTMTEPDKRGGDCVLLTRPHG